MKLGFHLVKGIEVNSEIVQGFEGWADYSPEEIKQVIDCLANGYKCAFRPNNIDEPVILEPSQIKSVIIHL
jgi:hypothetical protein